MNRELTKREKTLLLILVVLVLVLGYCKLFLEPRPLYRRRSKHAYKVDGKKHKVNGQCPQGFGGVC